MQYYRNHDMTSFKLQFEASLISELEGRYSFQNDYYALKAGEQIRGGQYTRKNLETIFEWKTNGRGRSRLAKNTDEEIADAQSQERSNGRTIRLGLDCKSQREWCKSASCFSCAHGDRPRPLQHLGSLAMLDATRLASSIVICFAVMASSSVERP